MPSAPERSRPSCSRHAFSSLQRKGSPAAFPVQVQCSGGPGVAQLFLPVQCCLHPTFPWARYNVQGSPSLPAFAPRGEGDCGTGLTGVLCWNLNLCHVLFVLFFVVLWPDAETPARRPRRGPLLVWAEGLQSKSYRAHGVSPKGGLISSSLLSTAWCDGHGVPPQDFTGLLRHRALLQLNESVGPDPSTHLP